MYYLDFSPMNEREMIEYLGEVEDLEKHIPEMLRYAYEKYEFREECIYRNTFPPMSEDGSGCLQRGGDPVFRTLVAVQRDMERQKREVEQEIQRILSWRRKLEHVKSCLLELPHEEREILSELYIKKKTVKEYALDHCLSESTTRRRGKKALTRLLKSYNTGLYLKRQGEDKP